MVLPFMLYLLKTSKKFTNHAIRTIPFGQKVVGKNYQNVMQCELSALPELVVNTSETSLAFSPGSLGSDVSMYM